MTKPCNGTPTEKPLHKQSMAYCEGMLHRASNTGAGAPITDNPYPDGRPVEQAEWDKGWTAANSAAGGTIPDSVASCCAARGLTVSI